MRVYQEPPNMGRAYLRALIERGRPLQGDVPEMRARLEPQTLDPAHLDAYRAACGATAEVPVGYPQLLSTRLHVGLLTDPEFPIRAMGLVHPRFSITQHRALSIDDQLAFDSWFDGTREVRNGIEFDIQTRALVADEVVWESTAATFHRTHRSEGAPKPAEEEETWGARRTFDVPANAGRRYARVSGDANPVHLHPWVSRFFGYKRPIAHGWWLVARCLSELGVDGPADLTTFTFDFRRPVFWAGPINSSSRAPSSRCSTTPAKSDCAEVSRHERDAIPQRDLVESRAAHLRRRTGAPRSATGCGTRARHDRR